jgi:hypothetical protein
MNSAGMKRLTAVVVALTVIGTASAGPIVMNISGELVSRSTTRPGEAIEFDNSVAGTAFTAQFVIEPDDFGTAQYTDSVGFQRWSYAALAGATGISASLSIGGVAVDLTPYDQSRALVNVLDSKGPIPGNCDPGSCASTTPDSYFVNFTSFQVPPASGNSAFRSLQFTTVRAA